MALVFPWPQRSLTFGLENACLEPITVNQSIHKFVNLKSTLHSNRVLRVALWQQHCLCVSAMIWYKCFFRCVFCLSVLGVDVSKRKDGGVRKSVLVKGEDHETPNDGATCEGRSLN